MCEVVKRLVSLGELGQVSVSTRFPVPLAEPSYCILGKTSLMTALFRIVELTSGSIRIDGLDIGEMGLCALRSKIAIIPQEAGIFSGEVYSTGFEARI